MKQSRNRSFHDAPQREVLAAVNEHPVVDGISEEIGTEAYQEYHNNTAESRAYNTAPDTAGGVADDGRAADFKETGKGQRNDNRREHSCGEDDCNC